MLSILNVKHNIIAQAEFRYQRYILEQSRSGLGWILLAAGLMLPAMLTSLVAFLLALFGAAIDDFAFLRGDFMRGIVNVFFAANMIMNIALYIVLTMIAVAFAYNSISREKSRRTWDVLLLTNVDSRTMVWGKWWASLMALWADHSMLVILRVGLACAVLVEPLHQHPRPLLVLAVVPVISAFTLLDVAFTTALGIASALSGLPSSVSGGIVFAVRFAGIAVAGFAYVAMLFFLSSRMDAWLFALSAGLLVIFFIGTVMSLFVAQWVAVKRDQVSPMA